MRNRIVWRDVLTRNRVEFVERGPNVKRGELNIRCPFCGSADPSHHMGLNQETGWWACWRNKEHRGKSPVRLLQRLLNISYNAARELCGFDAEYVDPDEFQTAVARFMGRVKPGATEAEGRTLSMPPEFLRVADLPTTLRDRTYAYLEQRLFTLRRDDPERLCEDYDLRGAYRGDYTSRVILPYYMSHYLVAWTGRALSLGAQVRYKDIPVQQAAVQVRATFYNHNAMLDPDAQVLIVVEGPFDALKLDFYLREHGVRAVALSTNNISAAQAGLLREHASQFRRVLVMLDQATELGIVDSMRLVRSISDIRNISIVRGLGLDVKDAGAMSPPQVQHLLRTLQHARYTE